MLIFFSCKNENLKLNPNFKGFIYLNFNLRENKSFKFNGSDTLYLQKRFPEEPVGNFIAILNTKERDSLIKKINDLNFEKYETQYINKHIEDGNSQVFAIKRCKKDESIYIHGRTGPKEINDLGHCFEKLKSSLKFTKTDEYLDFWNIKNIVTPPAPAPLVNEIKYKK